jgi:phospholipid/cholesterol/gamma-HCH transport system substrate-binding protein
MSAPTTRTTAVTTTGRVRSRSRVVRFATLMVVAALALTGCDFSVYSLPLPGGADLGDKPYQVTIEFRDVMDLVPQTSVKVDDVTVGKVDKIKVDGYHAEVTVLLRKSVKLPDNAEAKIRQTSLLGEKFVSLAPPPSGASSGRLGNGDTIPLERTGRNPEVEEVLGALSLLLNGGGVAQLKTISTELNKALGGREGSARSVLSQINVFMGQLDTNQDQIVRAIESLNRLAIALNKQKPAITQALDQLPRAIASINRQRDDLVKMLKALSDLSGIGTQVIRDSKAATIDSLRALAPTLTKLAETGDALPKSLQVFLTYPFVDAVVGTDPAQARNLHMGDYTNLSAQLDIDLGNLKLPVDPKIVCQVVPELGKKLCGDALDAALACIDKLGQGKVGSCTQGIIDSVCKNVPKQFPDICGQLPTGPVLSQLDKCLATRNPSSPACSKVGDLKAACADSRYKGSLVCQLVNRGPVPTVPGTPGTPSLPVPTPTLPVVPGLGRAGFGSSASSGGRVAKPDSDLGALLVWGMVER